MNSAPLSLFQRRFPYTATKLTKLHFNQGTPAFRSCVYTGSKVIDDAYFDTPDRKLERAKTWLRQRNDKWFARTILDGDIANGTYQDYQGKRACENMLAGFRMIRQRIPNKRRDGSIWVESGVVSTMKFATVRRKYTVDEIFNVSLDTTDFGYSVGEVELRWGDTKGGDKVIDEFMNKYNWFFGSRSDPVKGKLAAYLETFPREDLGGGDRFLAEID